MPTPAQGTTVMHPHPPKLATKTSLAITFGTTPARVASILNKQGIAPRGVANTTPVYGDDALQAVREATRLDVREVDRGE